MPSGWRETRLSKMLKETRMSFEDVLKCGSNFEMSPPWATFSSRRVDWACAWPDSPPGSAAVAPSAATFLSH